MTPTDGKVPLRYDVLAIVGGIVLASVLVAMICGSQVREVKELTLGKIEATDDQNDCLATDLRNGERILANAPTPRPVLLWLGNSQLTTVNNYSLDQYPTPILLQRELSRTGVQVVAFGPPNGNPQEHLVLFHAVSDRRKVGILLLAVCFDDLREDGVRPDIAIGLKDERVREAVSSSQVGKTLVHVAKPVSDDAQHHQPSSQELTESTLDRLLASFSPHWEARGRARSMIAVWLYQLRNTVFGIKPQTVRPVIASRYRKNMDALDALLDAARGKGVHVIVYLPPLRTDIPSPYDAVQHQQFKRELQTMVEGRGQFYDYEEVVPGDEWETKNGTALGVSEELDFMHFAYPGHVRFTRRLIDDLTGTGWIAKLWGRP